MKAVLLSAVVFYCCMATAGDKIGNGGGFWGCTAGHDLVRGQLVDLYEAKEEYGLQLISPTTSAMQIVDERSAYLSTQLPEYAAKLAPYLLEVKNNIRFVNAELKVIDDSLWHISPLHKYCPEGTWIYTQFANFTDQGQVLIRSDLWNHAKVSELDKAGLIWHEAVYRWLRVEKGDTNSVRARQVVGIIFSTLTGTEMKAKIKGVMDGGVPPTDNWVCMANNFATGRVYLSSSQIRREAELAALETCNADRGMFTGICSEHEIQCDQITTTIPKFYCEVQNFSTQRYFTSRGRSKVEASFKVMKACSEAGGFSPCSLSQVKCKEN